MPDISTGMTIAANAVSILGTLAGLSSTDPVEAARMIDDVDPIKCALSQIPVGAPCRVRLTLSNGETMLVTCLIELAFGAFRFRTPFDRGSDKEFVMRYAAVSSVDLNADFCYERKDK